MLNTPKSLMWQGWEYSGSNMLNYGTNHKYMLEMKLLNE